MINARLLLNPWSHRIPDRDLTDIVRRMCRSCAEHVGKICEPGEHGNASWALVLLDPTAPYWRPSDEAILVIVEFGSGGERLVYEAVARAMQFRDKGPNTNADPMRSADGDLCYGCATQVDSTIVAVSGMTEQRNESAAHHFGRGFNNLVRSAMKNWETRHPSNKWNCNDDQPGQRYKNTKFVTPIFRIVIHESPLD